MKRLLSLLGAGVIMMLAVFLSGIDADPMPGASTPLPLALGAIHPRISPSGDKIAVSYQGAIWSVPRVGGALTRLTDGEGFDHEPAWSPDEQFIAFVRGADEPAGQLRLIQVETGKDITLPKPVQVSGTLNFQKLEYHPDGGRILSILRSDGKDHGLAWYDLRTGAVKSLTMELSSGSRYALSADGKWVYFTSNLDKNEEQVGNNGAGTDLWKIPADGGPAEKIARCSSRIYDLCGSANGKSLIVISELGGAHNDLWQVSLSDPLAVMKKWSAGQADEDRPSISRDGKHLVYTDNKFGATALVVRDLATGLEQMVTVRRMDYRCPTGRLRLRVIDQNGKKSAVARISLQQHKGKFSAPPGSLYRVSRGLSHFYGDHSSEWELPAGKHVLRVYRGPEYQPVIQELTVQAGQTLDRTVELIRWTHAARSGWFSGENHIHANCGYGQWYNSPETMLQQCSGEDLNVCNFMVANCDTEGVFDRTYFRGGPDPRSTAETILYWNQEFRSTLWGHMNLLNLKQVVEPVFTGFRDTTNPWDIPTNADIADRTHWQKGHVNYTHPVQNAIKPLGNPYSAKALPIDVALGKIDSLDLNHSYAPTLPVWYRLLNCGFRLPPSAGTDCFLNRIFSRLPGGDRVYVHVTGPLSYAGWIDGLRKGRSFITNGPMLELTLEGQGLGEVVKIAGPRKQIVKASARSQFPLAKVELIYNGQVVATLRLDKDAKSATTEQAINVDRSGWLALRASGAGPTDSREGAQYAHTAPIYLEVADAPVRSRADAKFFLTWIDDLSIMYRTRDRVPNAELRRQVQDQLDTARAVYARIAREAQ